jgi:gas vesicle protein
LGLTGAAATTVSGAVTGALAGGIVGALTCIGIPEESAKYYEDIIKKGAIILAVPEKSGSFESRSILNQHNASKIEVVNIN